jgi:hypothetical protein
MSENTDSTTDIPAALEAPTDRLILEVGTT